MDTLRTAIIGCGSFGSKMARMLATLQPYEIVAVCDSDGNRAAALAEELECAAYESYARCISEPRVAAVALFTPNANHCEQAVAAAVAGKHVFCEKPMALSTEQCYRMIHAADQAGVRLMVGHKRRLRPQYAAMADVVRSRRLGTVLTVNIVGLFDREPQAWWRRREVCGGLLAYAGVHDIDFLRFICGEAASVSARTPVKMNHVTDYEDEISLLIHFETGPVATLTVCPFAPPLSFRQAFGVKIVLERGTVVYDPQTVSVIVHERGREPECRCFDNEAGFEQAYRKEFSSFAEWILADAEPVLTATDGLRCVEIMEAAGISAYTGTEISLPQDPERRRQLTYAREAAGVELFARGMSLPEGPAWGPDGALYVANCRSDFVSRIDARRTPERSFVTGGKTQGVTFHPAGDAFITDHTRKAILRVRLNAEMEVHAAAYSNGAPLRGPNEISFGPNGILYFTDPGNSWRWKPTGAFSCVLPDGTAQALAEGLQFPNGFDFSPSADTVYVVETGANRILYGDVASNGTIDGPLRELMQIEGRLGPDGIRCAQSGNLYVTLFGRGEVLILSPAGVVLDRLRVPGLFPTNCIFFDETLLVCEGQTGAIWRIPVKDRGIPSYAQRAWQETGVRRGAIDV